MQPLLKILFIANPNSTHTRRWVNWFIQRGHTAAVIADAPIKNAWEYVQVFDLPSHFNKRIIRYFVWEIKTRQIIHQWQPDILHAHRVSSAGWLGAFSNFHPLVITPWGTDLYQHPAKSSIARFLAGFTLQRADLVTADSHDLCSLAIHFGANPSITHLIQLGVDTGIFNPSETTGEWNNLFGITGRPVVLSPRGVNRIYNLDTIIRAISLIKPAFPGIIMILREYNVDPSYKAELERLIQQHGLQNTVCWIGEIEPYSNLADLYRLSDVVVSVPSSDGTPVSVLEAMACGAPVIASDLPSLREWISHRENGLLVPARDHITLASQITEILLNPGLRVLFASRNFILIKEKGTQDKEMSKMELLYRGLVN